MSSSPHPPAWLILYLTGKISGAVIKNPESCPGGSILELLPQDEYSKGSRWEPGDNESRLRFTQLVFLELAGTKEGTPMSVLNNPYSISKSWLSISPFGVKDPASIRGVQVILFILKGIFWLIALL